MRWAALLFAIGLPLLVSCGGEPGTVAAPGEEPQAETSPALTGGQAVAASCDSAADWVDGTDAGGLAIGPIVLHIASPIVTGDGKLLADWSPERGALAQKLPMSISAPVDALIRLRGVAETPGTWMLFEYPNETPEGVTGEPAAAPSFRLPSINRRNDSTFVPGGMQSSAAGCYQVFVAVDSVEYGPIGLPIAGPIS
ncbi:MAG: hypothetical protein WD557_08665 [Dehalococcoidia bacterium]